MKAVVAQVAGRHAVLLTKSGQFVRVRNQDYRPGQQISFSQRRVQPVKALLVAASLMLFLLGGTGLAAERLPFSYVSLDVNPSIEFALNWFDRVISLRAVNEDAEPTARQLKEEGAEHMPIATAIGMTLEHLKSREFFAGDSDNDVIIAVASYGLKNVSGLDEQLEGSIQSLSWSRELDVKAIATSASKVQEAKLYHTTAGKLALVEEVAALEGGNEAFTKEEWLQKPVREIMKFQKGGKHAPQEPDAGKTTESGKDAGILSALPTASLMPMKTQAPTGEGVEGLPQITYAPKKNENPSGRDKEGFKTATPKPKATEKPKATQQPVTDRQDPKDQDDKEGRGTPGNEHGKGITPKPNGQEGKPGSGHSGEGESNLPDKPKK